jgi:hypothetical protein
VAGKEGKRKKEERKRKRRGREGREGEGAALTGRTVNGSLNFLIYFFGGSVASPAVTIPLSLVKSRRSLKTTITCHVRFYSRHDK